MKGGNIRILKRFFLLKLFLIIFITMQTKNANAFSPLAGFKKTVFKNGLTVFIKKDSRLPVVTIQMWVRAGTLDENPKNNGVSHFLEHMLFKGTTHYNVSEISRTVESRGGIINAGTSKEFTQYYIDISTGGFDDSLKIIADIAQNATFPQEEFDRERLVVLEEIKRAEDNPDHSLYDGFNSELFNATKYRFLVLGTTQTISAMTRSDMLDYYKKFYIPQNMILVIAGDINPKKTLQSVKKLLNDMPQGIKIERENLIEPSKPHITSGVKKNVQQSYSLSGFLGPEIASKYQYPADVLGTILGGGRSSRLYKKLREEKQLVYSVGAGFESQIGSGVFYVMTISKPDKLTEIKKEITSEFDRLISENIPDSELDKAKELFKSSWYFNFETVHQQASTVGYWALAGRLDFVKTYIRKINKVSDKDIKKFLNTYYTGFTSFSVNPAPSR
ncbi:MAG: pitrilysin family protein [Elusimicrobiota bacterium]